jgi:hypothetical protein
LLKGAVTALAAGKEGLGSGMVDLQRAVPLIAKRSAHHLATCASHAFSLHKPPALTDGKPPAFDGGLSTVGSQP